MKLRLVSLLALGLGLLQAACGDPNNGEGAGGTSSRGGATNDAGQGGATTAGIGGSSGSAGSTAGGAAGTTAVPAFTHQLTTTLTGGCALDLKGELRCWGTSSNKMSWAPPPPGPFKAVAGSVCALTESGELSCFAEPDSLPSSEGLPKGPFVDLAMGSVACGLDAQGTVRCQDLVGMAAPSTDAFSAISIGRRFGCGIRKSDGSIACWGQSTLDCSGDMSLELGLTKPPSGSFIAIASSESNSCAVRTDGTLACWGAGSADYDDPSVMCGGTTRLNYGQSKPPTGTFKQVAVANEHACAIRSDDTVACWGAGKTDQKCADGNADLCGQSVAPAGQFAEVSVSWFYSCAMNSARKLTCWGANGRGQSTPPVDFP